MRILIVEDSLPVARAIRTMLEAQKFAASIVTDGRIGLDHLLGHRYDAAIVDVGLPTMDGFSVVREARAQGVRTPILMLTARDAVEDRVEGLCCGADDYVAKPFAESELSARLRAIVRRADQSSGTPIEAGRLHVDVGAHLASYDRTPLSLSVTEFRLLALLTRNAGIALSRSQIRDIVWECDIDGLSNIVDVYVSQLRRKLEELGGTGIIETVRNVGYRLIQTTRNRRLEEIS
jgi:two-component system, OmpR family, response regulator